MANPKEAGQAEAFQGRVSVSVPDQTSQWDVCEIVLHGGPAGGNPFTEVALQAEFSMGDRSVLALGFYDGDGVYRIRFMPEHQGKWMFRTSSNEPALHGLEGELECIAAAGGIMVRSGCGIPFILPMRTERPIFLSAPPATPGPIRGMKWSARRWIR